MRKSERRNTSTLAIALAFCAVLIVDAQSTTPSIPTERPEPPSPEEVMVLEELLEWVQGGPRATEFRPLTRRRDGVADFVRSRRRSFELFRSYNDEELLWGQLQDLPYGSLIRRVAHRHQVDGLLVAAVIEAESSFDAEAISPDGAIGLMQVMPATADLFGVSEWTDPAINVDLGTRYLSFLIRLYDGDLELALAAYNAGPGNVSRFDGVPPFGETRRYVEQVLARYVGHHQEVWQRAGGTASLVPGAPV